MSLATARQIGIRYIFSKRSSGFLSFVSIFATGGMALGVFALIVVLSVMNGFDRELKQRILRAVPHGFLTESGGMTDWHGLMAQLENHDRVLASSPFVGGNGLISVRGVVQGGLIQGISPEYEQHVSPISDFFVRGNMGELKPGEYGIVLGSLLAHSIRANIGDKVVVTLPKVSITLAGVFPRSRQFTVVGVFEVGAQVDQQLALIHIDDAKKLYRTGNRVDGLRVKFDDLYFAPTGMRELEQELNRHGVIKHQPTLVRRYAAKDWSETQGSLFQAVKLEKTVTGLLLSIIIAVAAFNIITSLIMMVTEKKSDIAVLRTMGLNRIGVMMIFVTQGVSNACLGIGLGLIIGVPAAVYLPELINFFQRLIGFEVFDPSVYFVSQIPSLWLWTDTVKIASFAFISSILATLYPAYKATLIEPAEAMRYDC